MNRCIAYFGFLLPLIVSCTSDLGSRAYTSGDYETAAQEWRLLAEQGDAESQAHLGDLYYEGRGVVQNGEESVQWYLMAAKQNHARAQGRLCKIFGDPGSRVQTDQQKAVKWCRKAAEQGSAGSQYRLGRLYLRGEGLPKDLVAAHMFLSIALENGHSRGDRELRSAVRQMTAEQIAESQRMAKEWTEEYQSIIARLPISHNPVQLIAGLAFLTTFLVGVRLRHRSVARPIRLRLTHRLLLASIAGWLAAWFLLPFGFFRIPETGGFFIPGTFFGFMVMVPMLNHPIRRLFRAAILVWAATIAHAAIWFTGFTIFGVADTYGDEFWLLIYVVPGLVFGAIVSVAMSRILNLRFERSIWFSIAIISVACGSAYVFAVLGEWPYWIESIEYLTFDDVPVFLIYVLWYVVSAAVFNLGKPQPAAPVTNTDFVLLGGLVLGTVLIGWYFLNG